jgi:hypothetical protein
VPSASEVLPPIVEAFRKRGSEPAGMHLAGYLGVVFDADRGLPVLDLENVRRLANSR